MTKSYINRMKTETQNNNKLIAEFIGMTKGRLGSLRWKNFWFDDNNVINGRHHEKLLFNTSWDWLIPVIKVCSHTLPFDKKATRKYNVIKGELANLEIEFAYKAVIEFIKYCNTVK